jgi:acyl carrier protein
VADGATRELRVEIDRASGDFSIASGEAEGGARTEHVRGTALFVAADSPDKRSLAELRERCNVRTLAFDGAVPQVHLRFGPRWSCVRQIRFGAGEAVAELELPEAFAADLPAFGLHPALLDMATGCAHALIPDFDAERDFYVPISYARVLARGPLPRRVTSHVRHREDHRAGRDFAIFDVTLFDAAGLPVVEIEEFMLKRIANHAALASEPAPAPGEATPLATAVATRASANPLLENLHEAIRPHEGLAALERILAAGAFPQIAVSPQPLLAWIERLTAAPEGRAPARGPAPAADPALLAAIAEIESVLREHPAVAAAAVTAHFDRPGERRLLAHVVWQPDRHATVSELRRFLRGRLSEDRVPQNIVELDALPVGADGAIERSRLHDPFGVADDYVAPRTETEKIIAKTWQEVLGIDRVGLHDNFFDVGGHSLLAMRVIVRTEKKLGVRLNNAIMVLQTLEQVAAECDKRLGASRATAASAAAAQPDDAAREGLSARLLRAVKRGVAQG